VEGEIAFLNGASEPNFGDINNDGLIDLAAIGVEENSVYAFINNSNGYDKVLVFPAIDLRKLRIADLDNDGYLDFVILTKEFNTLKILRNDGGAIPTFSTFMEFDYGKFPLDLEVVDVDKDNLLDIIIGFGDGSLVHLVNEGDLVFSKNLSFETDNVFPGDVDVLDLNQDGYNDIIYSDIVHRNVCVYYNDGSSLQFDKMEIANDLHSGGISQGDLNNDGLIDVLVSTLYSGLLLYTNTGQNFNKEEIDPELIISSGISLADLDKDDDLEIILNENAQSLHYYDYKDGSFDKFFITDLDITGQRIEVFDFDEDNDLDILVASYFIGRIFIFKNDLSTNIDNLLFNSMSVYPNPTQNYINIETDLKVNTINMMDISGHNVLSATSKQIDVRSLSSGVYFLEIETDSGTYAHKILKK